MPDLVLLVFYVDKPSSWELEAGWTCVLLDFIVSFKPKPTEATTNSTKANQRANMDGNHLHSTLNCFYLTRCLHIASPASGHQYKMEIYM